MTDHHQHVAAIHLEVTGLVQGVGFRWFVRERARALHLSGWVRNLESGNVEVAAAGDGLDVLRCPGAITQRLPNIGNHLGQCIVCNCHVGPERRENLVFRYESSRTRCEEKQEIERFWAERNGLTVAQQSKAGGVEPEWSEAIVRGWSAHRG